MGWRLDHSGREVPGGSERSDAARNRRRILEVARGLFEERGVGEVTMEEISRRAAVGKGTLYRRYPNKGLLCQALLDEPTRHLQREVMEVLGRPDLAPREKLCEFLDRLVWFMEDNLDLLYGGHQALPPADRLAHPAYDWRRGTVLGLLREAVRRDELDPDLDVEYVATALLAPLEVELYHHQRRVLGISAGRISAGLRSLVPG
ncbi:MAG: TetR/AcrR family transcriptional regulator [Rubrobacter sp.]|nr:TetR/AcrR family transcriptional regulator [Rubrobacter sp.]